jgi:hypothetical protein
VQQTAATTHCSPSHTARSANRGDHRYCEGQARGRGDQAGGDGRLRRPVQVQVQVGRMHRTMHEALSGEPIRAPNGLDGSAVHDGSVELVAGDRRAARTLGSRAARGSVSWTGTAPRSGPQRPPWPGRARPAMTFSRRSPGGQIRPTPAMRWRARPVGASRLNALLEYPQALESQQQLGPARTAQPPTGPSSATFTA